MVMVRVMVMAMVMVMVMVTVMVMVMVMVMFIVTLALVSTGPNYYYIGPKVAPLTLALVSTHSFTVSSINGPPRQSTATSLINRVSAAGRLTVR